MTVIRGKVEEVVLPEKVDVIISEPMGFMLVHERMLESYIAARDLFLKPGGLMMPTTGTIFFAPFTDRTLYQEQVCVCFHCRGVHCFTAHCAASFVLLPAGATVTCTACATRDGYRASVWYRSW